MFLKADGMISRWQGDCVFDHPEPMLTRAYTCEHQTETSFLLVSNDIDGDSTLDWKCIAPW
jgi:hypothetical protein